MADFDVNMPKDFVKDILGLSDSGKLCEEMLSEASPILVSSMKKRARRDTGAMAESIKATKPKENDRGYFTVVRPTGLDAKGIRNAEKMAYLEYGTSRMKAKPTIAKAVNDAEGRVLNTMQDVFDREVGG